MKALRFRNRRLELAAIPRPTAKSECIVRILLSGICNTDLEITKGYSGFEGTLGHEFVGIVEDAPDMPSLIGKRVAGEINVGCGDCPLCLGGDPRHCPGRTVLGIKGRDGTHAEYVSLPSSNLFEIPDGITDESAVFIEPLAAALGIVERIDLSSAQKIAIVGDGKLGLLCAMALKSPERHLTLLGKHRSKMLKAASAGVNTILVSDRPKPERAFDIVVEATGSDIGFSMALDLVRPRGTIVLKSTYAGIARIEAWRLVVDEITVVGSRCGRFGPAIQWLEDNRIDLASLISEEFPLSRGIEAFEMASRPGVLKVLLRNI